MVHIPYGRTLLDFEENGAAVLKSSVGSLNAEGSGSSIVRRAMEHPIDSPHLSELAKGRNNCVIIIWSLLKQKHPSKHFLAKPIMGSKLNGIM